MTFQLSLLILFASALSVFLYTFSRKPWTLAICVPILAVSGSVAYFSHQAVIGYPVEMTWEELPKEFTVVFFKVENKQRVYLWLLEGSKKRLVRLPYAKTAEDAMERQRPQMGRGTPVTFEKTEKQGNGEGKGKGKGKGKNGKPGKPGDGKGKQGTGQFEYRAKSFGDPIPGNTLPPKEG